MDRQYGLRPAQAVRKLLFDLLDECDAKTTDDLQNNWHKDIGRILTSIKKMDEANRKVISQTILSLLKITRKNVSNRSED